MAGLIKRYETQAAKLHHSRVRGQKEGLPGLSNPRIPPHVTASSRTSATECGAKDGTNGARFAVKDAAAIFCFALFAAAVRGEAQCSLLWDANSCKPYLVVHSLGCQLVTRRKQTQSILQNSALFSCICWHCLLLKLPVSRTHLVQRAICPSKVTCQVCYSVSDSPWSGVHTPLRE